MSRRFARAKQPIGCFTVRGERAPMLGHNSYLGAAPDMRSSDRQAEILPLVMAERARRAANPFQAVNVPLEAPRAPSLHATHGARSIFATIIGAVRRISGER